MYSVVAVSTYANERLEVLDHGHGADRLCARHQGKRLSERLRLAQSQHGSEGNTGARMSDTSSVERPCVCVRRLALVE